MSASSHYSEDSSYRENVVEVSYYVVCVMEDDVNR